MRSRSKLSHTTLYTKTPTSLEREVYLLFHWYYAKQVPVRHTYVGYHRDSRACDMYCTCTVYMYMYVHVPSEVHVSWLASVYVFRLKSLDNLSEYCTALWPCFCTNCELWKKARNTYSTSTHVPFFWAIEYFRVRSLRHIHWIRSQFPDIIAMVVLNFRRTNYFLGNLPSIYHNVSGKQIGTCIYFTKV